jgi:beta-N-acetylhexosaminidase
MRRVRARSAGYLRLLTAGASIVLLAAGCQAGHSTAATDPTGAGPVVGSPAGGDPTARAAALAASLDDLDLIGQLLVPFAYGQDATGVAAATAKANQRIGGVDTPAQMIAKFRLGGMILVNFDDGDPTADTNVTTNFVSPAQVRTLTSGLQTAARKLPAGVSLLIGTDQEYGVVTRLAAGVVQLPSALTLGGAHRPDLTEAAWAAAGRDLATVGLNVDFAPDADVLGGPGNTVIGSRSFGADPAGVSDQVGAAVTGLQSAGVAATIKHFPGHGDTSTDSHDALPVLRQSLAQLTATDLAPFRAGIAAGTDMIMSGHLDVTSIDPGVPASFSRKVLTDLLRTQLGFTGVVITDALNMKPAEKWSPGEAAVRAILAGNDMLLMPPDLTAAQKGLLDALGSGRLPRQQVVASVTRILELKLRLAATAKPGALSSLDSSAARAAVSRVDAAAVTVLRGPCHGAIVSGPVTVVTSAGRDLQRDWLSAALTADGVPVVGHGGAVIDLVGYGDAHADLTSGAAVTVAMDTPYLLGEASSAIRMATYSSTRAAMVALAAVIAGKAKAPGRSPVTVSGLPRSACVSEG